MRGWRIAQVLGLTSLVLAWLEVLLGCGFMRPAGPPLAGPLVLRAAVGAGAVTVRETHRVDTGAALAWEPFGPPGAWVQRPEGWVCLRPQPGSGLRLVPPPGTPVRVMLARGPGLGRCELTLGPRRWARSLALDYGAETGVLVDPRPTWLETPGDHALAALAALGVGALAWRGLAGPAWAALAGVSTAALLALVAAAGYPGQYSVDAMLQLQQALTGTYVDHHPPVVAGLWAALMAATGWLPSLWGFHLALVGAGLLAWGLAAWAAGVRAGLLGLPALLATPVALSCLGAMWKDVGFAGSLLLASGLVAVAHVRGRLTPALGLLALAAMFYAANARHNGLPALLPLLWVASGLWPGRRVLVRLVAVAGLAVGLLLGGKAISSHVLQARAVYLEQELELHDLAAVAVVAGKNHLPPHVRQHPNYNERMMHDEYWRSVHIFGGANFLMLEGWPPPLAMTTDPTEITALRLAWLTAIADAPGAYLRHRWWLYRRLLRLGGEAAVPPPKRPFHENDYRWVLKQAELQRACALTPEPPPATNARLAALRWAEVWRGSRLYHGWLYLVLALACLGLATARRRRHPLVPLGGMLAASALVYLGLYFFTTVWCEYRYLYWGGLATLLAWWAVGVGLAASRAWPPARPG